MFAETKKKGDLNEMQCMVAFKKLDYQVLIPFGDCERFDFVAYKDGQFLRIQCKAAHTDDNGKSFVFNNKSNNTIKGKLVSKPYTKEEIDYFATFFNDKCYLIPVEKCGINAKRLRLEPPANGQIKGISWAKDYEIERIIGELIEEVA